ncbi:hypothetical protein, partial [Stenotrophomonas maltophilia]|uniref:hypothetical protein n=1 Tax=Stenotrophomonas maltophilia TaxID=40324 RepID=UPI0019538BCB
LLDEILNRDVYRRPREVVGLTAYDDVHAEAGAYFQENIWTVVKYDRTSDSWLDQMKRKVRHIRLAKTSGIEPTKYESFLGIVTALHDPE